MIDLNETTDINQGQFEFKCEYCSQEYELETVNIAVFFYGVFFLVGNEHSYLGITCPSCMKTLLMKAEKEVFEFAKNNILFLVRFGDMEFQPDLPYHSSLHPVLSLGQPSIFENPVPDNCYIPSWHRAISGTDRVKSIEEQIQDNIPGQPEFENKYFCSYVLGGPPPMGQSIGVRWFEEEQIGNFVHIENDKKLTIFPRYVYRNGDYEAMAKFCWDKYLTPTWFTWMVQEAAKEEAEEQGISVSEYLAANPKMTEDGCSTVFDPTRDKGFSISYCFIEILTADEPPLEIPHHMGYPKHSETAEEIEMIFNPRMFFGAGLWKTKLPFKGREVPKTLANLDQTPYDKHEENSLHTEMAVEIKKNSHKAYLHRFLVEKYIDFIKDYIKIAPRTDFSYAALWDLKESYLKQAYDLIKSKQKILPCQRHRKESRTVAKRLWKEDPTITIRDMAFCDEITDVYIKERKGKMYTEDAIRGWINDLCPNREPGRRSKKPKT